MVESRLPLLAAMVLVVPRLRRSENWACLDVLGSGYALADKIHPMRKSLSRQSMCIAEVNRLGLCAAFPPAYQWVPPLYICVPLCDHAAARRLGSVHGTGASYGNCNVRAMLWERSCPERCWCWSLEWEATLLSFNVYEGLIRLVGLLQVIY